jgi:signal peptidase II
VPDLQAARGASLIASETSAEPTSGPTSGKSATVLALVVAGTAWAVDVVSKQLAVRELTGRESVDVVGDLLRLTLVRNPGAAFSTGTSFTLVISVIAIVAAVVITSYILKVRHRGWAVALGLLLAGVLGNLTDRFCASRVRCAVMSWTSSSCRTGRSSTSPTSASTSRRWAS